MNSGFAGSRETTLFQAIPQRLHVMLERSPWLQAWPQAQVSQATAFQDGASGAPFRSYLNLRS